MKKINWPLRCWWLQMMLLAVNPRFTLRTSKTYHRKALLESMKSIPKCFLHPLKDFKARNVGPTNMSGECGIESHKIKNILCRRASGELPWNRGQWSIPSLRSSIIQGGTGTSAICSFAHPIMTSSGGTGEVIPPIKPNAGARNSYKPHDACKTCRWGPCLYSQHIGPLQIHPTNPDVVWVGSNGGLYSKNKERGSIKLQMVGQSLEKDPLHWLTNKDQCDIKIHPTNPISFCLLAWSDRQQHEFHRNARVFDLEIRRWWKYLKRQKIFKKEVWQGESPLILAK